MSPNALPDILFVCITELHPAARPGKRLIVTTSGALAVTAAGALMCSPPDRQAALPSPHLC